MAFSFYKTVLLLKLFYLFICCVYYLEIGSILVTENTSKQANIANTAK